MQPTFNEFGPGNPPDPNWLEKLRKELAEQEIREALEDMRKEYIKDNNSIYHPPDNVNTEE